MTSSFKATTPADLLAFVPVQLGFWPENSLVLIGLRDKRLGAILRVDLPPVGTDTAEIALLVSSMMEADELATAFIGVIYDPSDGAEGTAAHYRSLVSDLELGLAHELHDMFIVSSGMVLSLHDGTAFSVNAIKSSPMALEFMMMGRGYTTGAKVSIPEAGEVDPADAKILSTVERAFTEEEDWGVESIKSIWHTCPGVAGLDHGGYLILLASIQSKMGRDTALATIMSAGQIPADDVDTLGMYLMGSPNVTPDWERADGFVEVLNRLLTIASGPLRQAPLTMLGAIEWYKGRASYAAEYFDAVLATDPDYRLALLMSEMCSRGFICPWAQNPDTAYKGQ